MYELKQGSARLVKALYDRRNDPETVRMMAAILDYLPQQLQEDIVALNDRFDQTEQEDSP